MEEMHNSGFDVVFYYIKENIETTEFVFAQFNPIDGMVINKAYEEDKEEAKKLFDGCMINRTAPRIPLFLPKLMTSAIHLGPYVLKSEMYQSKSLGDYQDLVPVEFSNWLDHLANKNTSNPKIIELINQNKHEIYYYSDFVILSINQPYEDCDCYGMETVQTNYKFGMIEIEWYAKKSYDIGEYTNYELDLTYRNTNYNMCNVMERSKPEVLYSFLEMLQRKHVSQDMAYYSVFIYTLKDTNKTNTIPLFCSELKEHMNNLLSGGSEMDNIINPIFKENGKKFKDYLNEKMPSVYDISKVHISVKNVNYTKSKLGLNYNILNIFF
ncbi:hypothetical protein NEIRO03_2533 [Nematocida sp. AWRm78]|nr:hypothetical protein NEIRO02_2532 [Nematocida sp. AWRm79]KAI5187421.1 hypothetical protein NEIRO03_2533 [Nematocida sp. AWRm78]